MYSSEFGHQEIYFDVVDATIELLRAAEVFEVSLRSVDATPANIEEYKVVLRENGLDWDDQSANEYLESRKEDIKLLRNVLCQSVFMSGYSLFEHGMMQVANAYLVSSGSKLRIGNFSGVGLEKVRVCAAKLAEYEFENSQWRDIVFFREVRNIIAHNSGIVNPERRSSVLVAGIERFHGVQLGSFGRGEMSRIKLSDFFVRHCLQSFRTWVNQFHDALEERLKSC